MKTKLTTAEIMLIVLSFGISGGFAGAVFFGVVGALFGFMFGGAIGIIFVIKYRSRGTNDDKVKNKELILDK